MATLAVESGSRRSYVVPALAAATVVTTLVASTLLTRRVNTTAVTVGKLGFGIAALQTVGFGTAFALGGFRGPSTGDSGVLDAQAGTATVPTLPPQTTNPPTTMPTPASNIPDDWASGPIVKLTYDIGAVRPFYGGGTKVARPISHTNPMRSYGTSFQRALDAANDIASKKTKFEGINVTGSAAVLQARDGTFYVTELYIDDPGGTGSPPVDGSAKKLFVTKSFNDVVKKFTIDSGVEGLRAIVGEKGYWQVDSHGKGAGYIKF